MKNPHMTENLQKISQQIRPVNNTKKQAMPIERERDSVSFKGRKLRAMDGLKVQSCFNEKANTTNHICLLYWCGQGRNLQVLIDLEKRVCLEL